MRHSIFIQLVKRAKQNYFSIKHLILAEYHDQAMISLSFMHHFYHTYQLLLSISTCFIIWDTTLGMIEQRTAIKYNAEKQGGKKRPVTQHPVNDPLSHKLKQQWWPIILSMQQSSQVQGNTVNCLLAIKYTSAYLSWC